MATSGSRGPRTERSSGRRLAPDASTAIDRRRLLGGIWQGVGAGLALALLPGADLGARPRWSTNPFTLGVASGDPAADGAVLWTRLAPDPADPSALGNERLRVGWRVATDPAMRSVVRRGLGRADPDLAHSVHVEVHGLRPGRDHWFQFDVGGEESPVGHFRTAPGAFDEPPELRFAFVTCQDWPSGHYTAYRDMYQRDLDLDLVLHLGDYTYEYAIGGNNRGIPTPAGFEAEAVDLRTSRLRHTLHKLDPDLQAMHAAVPFVVVWDDHEVQNDYSGIYPEYADTSPAFLARRAAAYQAWYEHMPVRRSALARPGDELRIYRRLRYGRLAEFTMLDDRQYRDDNPCGDGESLRCEAALADDYSMLGPTQERWVTQGLRRSRARWNIIGQQLLLAELEHLPYQDERYWNDAWDGYPMARQRLLEQVVANDVSNPVFLTGDWHSTFVNDLKLDFKDPSAPTIATELVTPAITTGGDGTPYGPYYGPMIPYNPHIRYYEGDRRGYFAARLTPDTLEAELRFVTSVEDPAGTGYTERTFTVEDGNPGAVV